MTHNGSKPRDYVLSVQSYTEHLYHPSKDQGIFGRRCGKNRKAGGWGQYRGTMSSNYDIAVALMNSTAAVVYLHKTWLSTIHHI